MTTIKEGACTTCGLHPALPTRDGCVYRPCERCFVLERESVTAHVLAEAVRLREAQDGRALLDGLKRKASLLHATAKLLASQKGQA